MAGGARGEVEVAKLGAMLTCIQHLQRHRQHQQQRRPNVCQRHYSRRAIGGRRPFSFMVIFSLVTRLSDGCVMIAIRICLIIPPAPHALSLSLALPPSPSSPCLALSPSHSFILVYACSPNSFCLVGSSYFLLLPSYLLSSHFLVGLFNALTHPLTLSVFTPSF